MLTKTRSWVPSCLFTLFVFIAFTATAQQQSANAKGSARETLNHYCVTCHNETLKTAGLMLDKLDPDQVATDALKWEKVARKLRGRTMPPAGMPRPDEATYNKLVAHIEGNLDKNAKDHPNPGRPTLHRLNRSEYANVIRDLLALEINSRDLLPADDIGYGFDNIGDVLTVSPYLLERYLSVASKISRLAIGDTHQPANFQTYDVSRYLIQDDRMNEELPYGSRGGIVIRHHFPVDGEYLIKVKLQTGRFDEIIGMDKERKLDIRLDNQRLQRFTVAASAQGDVEVHGNGVDPDEHLEIRLPIKAGMHTVEATFIKDTVKEEGMLDKYAAPTANQEQAFFEGVGKLSIAGPFNITGPGDTPSRRKIFSCQPSATLSEDECARQIITTLARSAYRRPVAESDMPVLLRMYEQGKAEDGYEGGIRMALQKILVSPEFLFRMEFDPEHIAANGNYRISDLELASRLSFFLWSSLPDEELLTLAEKNQLHKPSVLEKQTKRMLADERSRALVNNFSGQWLYLRNMARVQPDPIAFPNFDENLRDSMQKETELLLESMLHEDHSVVELLDSDYTFINERLARHYGIEGIYGAGFQRVKITDPRRRGLLGQGSILTVTSYPNRTAPTIRGKWVLEQLLNSPPPPPPPNVPSLKDDKSTKVLTMRQRMEKHRANPACAVCHKVMDPLGFALENFDGLGRWRETSGTNNSPIDSSGELPDGTGFDGPAGLREVLLKQKELFVDTFTLRLITYALGRGVEYYDYPVIRKIRQEAADSDYRWSAIINGIVNSIPFQMRRANQP